MPPGRLPVARLVLRGLVGLRRALTRASTEVLAATDPSSPGGSSWTTEEVADVAREVGAGVEALAAEVLHEVLSARGLLVTDDES